MLYDKAQQGRISSPSDTSGGPREAPAPMAAPAQYSYVACAAGIRPQPYAATRSQLGNVQAILSQAGLKPLGISSLRAVGCHRAFYSTYRCKTRASTWVVVICGQHRSSQRKSQSEKRAGSGTGLHAVGFLGDYLDRPGRVPNLATFTGSTSMPV